MANVSDNTRHRHQCHPVTIKSSISNNNKKVSFIHNEVHPIVHSSPSPKLTTNTTDTNLPSITEDSDPSTPPPTTPDLSSTLDELQIDPSTFNTHQLSPTQILEVSNAVISHLKKHGKIILDLS